MSLESLKDKVAVVTGGGGTLCSEMAKNLADQGVKVVLIGRTLDKLQRVESEIKSENGQAMAVSADVTDLEAIKQAEEKVERIWGPCNILINGAGGNKSEAVTETVTFDEQELDEESKTKGFFNLNMKSFLDVIQVNTMGTVIPCQIFGRAMAANQTGNIINIASMNSYRPLTRVAAYAIGKAGIANFTKWLAAYLANSNIRVNAIAPGFFLNDRSRKLLLKPDGYTDRGQQILNHTPLKRFGEAPELIGCMNWLINDDASGFVTGNVIPVDGGFRAYSGV